MARIGRTTPVKTLFLRSPSFTPTNVYPVGTALENTNQALAIGRIKVFSTPFTKALETDTAPTPTKATRFKLIGTALETDIAKLGRRILLGIAVENQLAVSISFIQRYFFTPPSFKQRMQPDPPYDRLWDWYSIDVGYSLLKKDGVYTLTPYPIHDDVVAADVAYIGGHIYEINKAEAEALTAAGYALFITSPVDKFLTITTAVAHVSAQSVNRRQVIALGTATASQTAVAGAVGRLKRRTALISSVTTSALAIGKIQGGGGGTSNLAFGMTATSNQPWDTNATNGTMATNIHAAVTWGNQHTFNFGGRIGESHDGGQPGGFADQWSRTFDLTDQRFSNFTTCNLPHKIMTLYAAPVTITGLGDFDYSIAAPQPGNRAALARWAVEVIKRYQNQGVTHFEYYNELKGYSNFTDYMNDWNAIYTAVKADSQAQSALLGGPYVIFSQRQSGWGPSAIQGAWGAVHPDIVSQYQTFLNNGAYDFIAVDLSAGDQSGDITGNYNPNNLPFSTMVQYFHDVAAWLDTHVAGSKPVICAEIYGWSGTNADQFESAVTTWKGGFATGRQTVTILWNEADNIAGRVVDKATSQLATIGQRMVTLRNNGTAQ